MLYILGGAALCVCRCLLSPSPEFASCLSKPIDSTMLHHASTLLSEEQKGAPMFALLALGKARLDHMIDACKTPDP